MQKQQKQMQNQYKNKHLLLLEKRKVKNLEK
jgi:hypothetical protein